MDRPNGSLTWGDLVEAEIALEWIQAGDGGDNGRRPLWIISPGDEILAIERPGQETFGAVAEGFEHLAHAALVRKAHQHEFTVAAGGACQWGRIAPESTLPTHGRFVEAGIRKGKHPHLINLAVGHARQDAETGQDGLVIHRLRFVRSGRLVEHGRVRGRVIAVAIRQRWELVHVNALDDLVARQAAAGLLDIGHEAADQLFHPLPVHHLRELLSAIRIHDWIVDDQQNARGDDVRWLGGVIGWRRRSRNRRLRRGLLRRGRDRGRRLRRDLLRRGRDRDRRLRLQRAARGWLRDAEQGAQEFDEEVEEFAETTGRVAHDASVMVHPLRNGSLNAYPKNLRSADFSPQTKVCTPLFG